MPASPPDPTAADAASGRSRAAIEPFDVAGLGRSGSVTVDVSLGSFDDLAVWVVPAAVLGVPGLLILLVLSIQILGGAMWLPLIRSSLRGVGVGDS